MVIAVCKLIGLNLWRKHPIRIGLNLNCLHHGALPGMYRHVTLVSTQMFTYSEVSYNQDYGQSSADQSCNPGYGFLPIS